MPDGNSVQAARLPPALSFPAMDEPALRQRVRDICMAFPETSERIQNPLHSGFLVREKTFCYYLNDHHGDGRLALTFKAVRGALGDFLEMDRDRFFAPPYMAHHGWVGLYLDVEPIDWALIEQLVTEAYRLSAPKKLAAMVAAP